MTQPASIFIVDDHTIVRNGLKELIERMGNYTVSAQFDHGKQLIDQIPFKQAPDLILMDLTMPVMDGQSTVRWLRGQEIDYPVLILTLDTTDKTIIELFRLGVRGYLPKSCTAEALKKAIDDILRTGYYHNELMTKALQISEAHMPKDERQEILKQLTDREKTFLTLVCDPEEYTYEQIADKMSVHRRTVDGYREAMFDKFSIKSKTGLVLFAIKYRLIDDLSVQK